MHTYICLFREVCLTSPGFSSGGFVQRFFAWKVLFRGGFCPSLHLSEYTSYNRKLNITFNFRFEKCDVACSWTHPPVTNWHILSDPLPLERDVLYGRPL